MKEVCNMKKAFCIVIAGALAATMCVALAGCGNDEKKQETTTQPTTVQPTTQAVTVAPSQAQTTPSQPSIGGNTDSTESTTAPANDRQSDDSDSDIRAAAIAYLGLSNDAASSAAIEETLQTPSGVSFTRVRVYNGQTGETSVVFVSEDGEVVNLTTFNMIMEETGDNGDDNVVEGYDDDDGYDDDGYDDDYDYDDGYDDYDYDYDDDDNQVEPYVE